MKEETLRHEMVRLSKSLFERGYTSGSSGNISARLNDGFLVTPTNSCLGFLKAENITKLDGNGDYMSGDKPTKELPLHLTFYKARPQAKAIVHTHSTFSTLLSCRIDIDRSNVLPPLTPYAIMRLGKVAFIPYVTPGSSAIIPYLLELAPTHSAILMGNHGPVVSASTLEGAFFALEEFEEAAKMAHLSQGYPIRTLSPKDLSELDNIRII